MKLGLSSPPLQLNVGDQRIYVLSGTRQWPERINESSHNYGPGTKPKSSGRRADALHVSYGSAVLQGQLDKDGQYEIQLSRDVE